MQKVRKLAVPAAGAAPLVVRCTMVTTRMEIREDASANAGVAQGLIYQLYQPLKVASANQGVGELAPGDTIQVLPGSEPIVIAGHLVDHSPHKEPIGNGGSAPFPVAPGGPVTHGTKIIQLTSASGNATSIDVTEWN